MICVFGAGRIGLYVGGRLAATGAEVVLIGRERVARELADGLELTDLDDSRLRVDRPRFATAPDAAADADLVVVSVKSGATAEAAATLAPLLRPGTAVVSLQNGLRNARVLREHLPEAVVLPGMVGFNVVRLGPGRYHRSTAGLVEVEDHPALTPFREAFARAGLDLRRHRDLTGVQAAKLLLNLNNAVNALSGLPLRDELAQRPYRRVLAAAQREALAAYRAAAIRPARVAGVAPALLPIVLGLPDALYRRVAARSLPMDPLARSSTWDDLESGRPTEVDHLNGEIVALAAEHGTEAPVNARLTALVHDAEQGGRRDFTGRGLAAEVLR